MAERKNMEIIILKVIACVCVTIIAGIMAWRDEEDRAVTLMLLGLALIFIPWDKVIELFQI